MTAPTPTPRVPLVVVGAGGHGREALDIIEALPDGGGFEVVGFLSEPRDDEHLLVARGHRILGPVDRQPDLAPHLVLAVGLSVTRRQVAALVRGNAVRLVHPTAVVGEGVGHGVGFLAAAGARLGTGCRVGDHVHLNVNASVGARAVLGDFVTLSPGARVDDDAVLGPASFVGAGARVREGRIVGEGSVVGAGAVVEADVPAGVRVVGVPATAL